MALRKEEKSVASFAISVEFLKMDNYNLAIKQYKHTILISIFIETAKRC